MLETYNRHASLAMTEELVYRALLEMTEELVCHVSLAMTGELVCLVSLAMPEGEGAAADLQNEGETIIYWNHFLDVDAVAID